MNFGAELDDDLFEIPKLRKDESSNTYVPKIQTIEWFNYDDDNCVDGTDQLKFQANFLYYHHKYNEAKEKYLQCLEILDDSNVTAKRDCLEGIARSFMHLNAYEEALQYALKLHASSQNIDQKIIDWNLSSTIYHQMKRYEDELVLLQNCLKYHPWNYDFWIRLAFCYSGIFGIQLNSKLQCDLLNISNKSNKFLKENENQCSRKDSIYSENKGHQIEDGYIKQNDNPKGKVFFNFNNLINKKKSLIVCACLIRARVLLQTCILGYRSFTLQNNSQQQKMINELINTMDIDDDFIRNTTELYLREINIKAYEGENIYCSEANSSNSNEEISKQNEFETAWFGWILKNNDNKEDNNIV